MAEFTVKRGTKRVQYVQLVDTSGVYVDASAGGGGGGGGEELPTTGDWVDSSTTITSGGVSQILMATNADRIRAIVQNPTSAIESLYINFGASAVADSNSIELPPGTKWQEESPLTTQAIHVIGATTGHVVIAKEMSSV